MEHRWGERIQVDFPIRVTSHRFSVRDGRLTDLSVSGALIEAQIDARTLCRVRVAIDLPLWLKHESPVVDAYVARQHRSGIGLEWCEFAPDAVRELLRAVAARPHARIRRHDASASLTVSRLSGPLLKHRD